MFPPGIKAINVAVTMIFKEMTEKYNHAYKIISFRKCSTKRRLEIRKDIEPACHAAPSKHQTQTYLEEAKNEVSVIGKIRWFEGQIISYNPATSQYGAYTFHLIIRP